MSNSSSQIPSTEDKCRGLSYPQHASLIIIINLFIDLTTFTAAQIMNNVSSLIISKSPTPATFAQAETWARKSVAVCGQEIDGEKKGNAEQLSVCQTTLAVALFNIASLREVNEGLCTFFDA